MLRFTIRDVLWLMVVAGIGVAAVTDAAEPGPTLADLATQDAEPPHSTPQAVRHYLKFHESAQWGVNRHILVVSWFIGKPRYVLRYTVTEDGRATNVRAVYAHALQAGHDEMFSAARLESLKQLLAKLPESKAEPPVERTVHVSFQFGEKWRTETYDAAALPDEFEQVIKILGERFETKDRHKAK